MGTFLRAQAASLIATIFDFGLFFLLVEITGLWYPLANGIGNVGGAVINFTVGRSWVFDASHSSKLSQAWKYSLVWFGYLIINFLSMVFLKHFFQMDYRVAKVIVALLLSVTYNYLLQKSFIFK